MWPEILHSSVQCDLDRAKLVQSIALTSMGKDNLIAPAGDHPG